MADSSAIREKVIEHLLEASDAEMTAGDVTDETSLRDDLDLGSLQAVTMVMDLEEEFGIAVEDEELEGLNLVSDLLSLIESKKQED